jgi:hypothetical protein
VKKLVTLALAFGMIAAIGCSSSSSSGTTKTTTSQTKTEAK